MNLFADIRSFVLSTLDTLVADGFLPEGLSFDAITVEPPRDAAHGDMATNAAMVLAKPARMKPRDIAEKLAEKLAEDPRDHGGGCGGAGVLEPAAERCGLAGRCRCRSGGRAQILAGAIWGRASGSTSNMSRPTRRGRCMWGTPAVRSLAMRWRPCWISPASM